MTQPIWEKVERGRYAAELHGHIIQAIRKDPPYDPDDRPYVAIVDKVPVGDAWNLNIAKTKAIQHVQRQAGKAKAERVFTNGAKVALPPEQEEVSDPAVIECKPVETSHDIEHDTVLIAEGYAEQAEPSLPVDEPPQAETALDTAMSHLAVPGQLVISGKLGSGDLLDTLNAMRSALELLREHADVECIINMPPVMKL